MDILISSNLERLLYHLCGEDSEARRAGHERAWPRPAVYDLAGGAVRDKVQSVLLRLLRRRQAPSPDHPARPVGTRKATCCDTHTAVAVHVYRQDYSAVTSDEDVPAVVASTASPYKFSGSVLDARWAEPTSRRNDFQILKPLEDCHSGAQRSCPGCRPCGRSRSALTAGDRPGRTAAAVRLGSSADLRMSTVTPSRDLHLSPGRQISPWTSSGAGRTMWSAWRSNWRRLVQEGDTVVLLGDISWAMKLEDAAAGFCQFHEQPAGTRRSSSRATTTTGGPPAARLTSSWRSTAFLT